MILGMHKKNAFVIQRNVEFLTSKGTFGPFGEAFLYPNMNEALEDSHPENGEVVREVHIEIEIRLAKLGDPVTREKTEN